MFNAWQVFLWLVLVVSTSLLISCTGRRWILPSLLRGVGFGICAFRRRRREFERRGGRMSINIIIASKDFFLGLCKLVETPLVL